MELRELLEYCKAEAIANTVSATEVSVWRTLCREYSKKFSTPLHLCLDGTIDPEAIVLAEFEDQLSNFKEEDHLDSILDQIYTLEDPDYESAKSEELYNFVEKAEKEEAERLRLGKPIHKALAQDPQIKEVEPQHVVRKKSGSINLSYLAREEESQLGGGFEE